MRLIFIFIREKEGNKRAMFKLDNELIKDRFAATSFSFYTDDEI